MSIGFSKQPNEKESTDKKDVLQKQAAKKVQKQQDDSGQKINIDVRSRATMKSQDSTSAAKQEDVETDDDFDIQPNKKKDKRLIYIGAAVLGIIGISLIYTVITKKPVQPDQVVDDSVLEESTEPDEEDPYIYDENGKAIYSKEDNSVVDDSAIDPGAADYEESTQNQTTSKVYDSGDTLKDINGVDIAATYNVVSRDYLYDYVSYVAKRGIIDDGMEIYWLEASYHGKKYRIQVPFYYFKDFDEEGVCRVQIEVLNIEGGGKVISYMQVVNNESEED